MVCVGIGTMMRGCASFESDKKIVWAGALVFAGEREKLDFLPSGNWMH